MSERKELLTDHLCSIIEQVGYHHLRHHQHAHHHHNHYHHQSIYIEVIIPFYMVELQNEQRKAKRLTELMVELQLDSPNSNMASDLVCISSLS